MKADKFKYYLVNMLKISIFASSSVQYGPYTFNKQTSLFIT